MIDDGLGFWTGQVKEQNSEYDHLNKRQFVESMKSCTRKSTMGGTGRIKIYHFYSPLPKLHSFHLFLINGILLEHLQHSPRDVQVKK